MLLIMIICIKVLEHVVKSQSQTHKRQTKYVTLHDDKLCGQPSNLTCCPHPPVPQAVAQFKKDKMEYDADMVQQTATEQIKNMKVMQWLQKNVKVEVLPFQAAA